MLALLFWRGGGDFIPTPKLPCIRNQNKEILPQRFFFMGGKNVLITQLYVAGMIPKNGFGSCSEPWKLRIPGRKFDLIFQKRKRLLRENVKNNF